MGNSTELLQQIREQDEKDKVAESPENESLHPQRVYNYLEANNIDAKNFDERFNFGTALDILRVKKTPGEAAMEKELVSAKDFLDKAGLNGLEMLSDYDEDTFRSTLHKELMTRNSLNQEKLIINAHNKYLLIRNIAFRRLQIQEHFTGVRDDEKLDATGKLKDSFNGVVKDVKANFAKMSSKEKTIAVGALVIGAVWLFSQSDNPKVQKLKDGLWTAAKVAGAGIGFNYVYKMFTGKTAWTAASDFVGKTVNSDGFWQESFKTDPEKAEILQKSVVYMGDQDIMDLEKQYRQAKASNSNKIRLVSVAASDMSEEEIFAAVDTFFRRYPSDMITKKYKNWPRESRNWRTVISNEMTEDGRLEYRENILSKTYDGLRYALYNGYNWLVADGFGVSAYLYKKAWGREGTETEVKSWIKEYLENVVENEAGLPKYLDDKFKTKVGEHYKEVVDRGHVEKNKMVKFMEVPGDSIYVMSTVKIDNAAGNQKALGDAMRLAQSQIMDFLSERFPEHKENLAKFLVVNGGASTVEDASFRLFARMPLNGAPDYLSINTGSQTAESLAKKDKKEILEGEIKYSGMEPWRQEKLRLRFLMDSAQKPELEKICDWFSRKYKVLAVPREDVFKAMFENDKDRETALEDTNVKQGLTENSQLLTHDLEGKLSDIEKDAASAAPREMFSELVEQMQLNLGNKVRLAILGDGAAVNETKYVRNSKDALDNLLSDYKALCKQFVNKKLQK